MVRILSAFGGRILLGDVPSLLADNHYHLTFVVDVVAFRWDFDFGAVKDQAGCQFGEDSRVGDEAPRRPDRRPLSRNPDDFGNPQRIYRQLQGDVGKAGRLARGPGIGEQISVQLLNGCAFKQAVGRFAGQCVPDVARHCLKYRQWPWAFPGGKKRLRWNRDLKYRQCVCLGTSLPGGNRRWCTGNAFLA